MFRFPQGESLQDLVARAANALRCILQRHRDQTTILVSHDSVNRALLTQVLDQPLSAYSRISIDPCGITEVEFDRISVRVLKVNETEHLSAISQMGAKST
jgi:probable phosphoglycerate mutase